jgi:hypothetical protein
MVLQLTPSNPLGWKTLSAEVAIVCNGLLRIDKRVVDFMVGLGGLEPPPSPLSG